MAIQVRCPHCRGDFQVADKYAGSKIRCPKCKAGVIEVACAAPAAFKTGFDSDLMLKPIESDSSALSAPPRRRRRSFFKNKALRNWVGTLMVAGGLLAAAGYTWQLVSQANLAGLKLPQVDLGSVTGGSGIAAKSQGGASSQVGPESSPEGVASVASQSQPTEQPVVETSPPTVDPMLNASMSPEADQSYSATKTPDFGSLNNSTFNDQYVAVFWNHATQMRSKLHPFEIDFPSTRVIAIPTLEGVGGGIGSYTYLHRLDTGMIHDRFVLHSDLTPAYANVLAVRFSPRLEGETDQAAIARVAPVDLSNRSGVQVEHKPIHYEGFYAVDTSIVFEPRSENSVVRMRSRAIAHPTGVYVIGATMKGVNAATINYFIDSFHFTDRPGSPGDGSELIPVYSQYGLRPAPRDLTGNVSAQGHFIMWEDIPVE